MLVHAHQSSGSLDLQPSATEPHPQPLNAPNSSLTWCGGYLRVQLSS